MVKSPPRIQQLQLLYPRSKIMKKKSITRQRRSISSSNSLSSPPRSSPEFLLKRTCTHDPASLFSDSKKIRKTITEDLSPTTEFSISSTLEGYLPPPLPPPPSPEFLRRTVSCPTTSLSSSTSGNVTTFKEMKAETKTVSMTGEWMMVKCSYDCGKDYTILINKADNKCHKLV